MENFFYEKKKYAPFLMLHIIKRNVTGEKTASIKIYIKKLIKNPTKILIKED